MTDVTLQVLDAIIALPAAWLICWLVVGFISGKGVTLRLGWTWCAIGLLAVALLVCRLHGIIP